MSKRDDSTPPSLWRTRRQDLAWVLRGRGFRVFAALTLVAVIAGAGWWQWPTISIAVERVTHALGQRDSTYEPVQIAPAVDKDTNAKLDKATADLTRAIGAADAMITAKIAEGVPTEATAATKAAMAAAQEAIDKKVRILPTLSDKLSTLQAATTALSAQHKPADPAPAPAPPPAPAPEPDPGNQGGWNGGGSTDTGGSNGGGTSTSTVSTSSSITCPGGNVRVTFSASGGGNVSLSVSGPASGSNSGSGGTSVTVIGPSGNYSGYATGEGSVNISASCG